jgi:plasmid stability protein
MSSEQTKPYPLRMPDELREALSELAAASGRSLNAEILARLQASMTAQAGPPDLDAFADQLAEKLAARMKRK